VRGKQELKGGGAKVVTGMFDHRGRALLLREFDNFCLLGLGRLPGAGGLDAITSECRLGCFELAVVLLGGGFDLGD